MNKYFDFFIFLTVILFFIKELYIILKLIIAKIYKTYFKKIIITKEDKKFLSKQISFYKNLSLEAKRVFEKKLIEFLRIYEIVGVDLELNHQDRLLVAASGTIPVFRFKYWRYPDLHTIYLFEDSFTYNAPGVPRDRKLNGLVGFGYLKGKMYLSRKALYNGFESANRGKNTGIHEFLHLIDMEDGSTDGIPEVLLDKKLYKPWEELIKIEIEKICNDESVINEYACENAAEFFAEAGVHFFEKPEELQKYHPELYDLLYQIFMTK